MKNSLLFFLLINFLLFSSTKTYTQSYKNNIENYKDYSKLKGKPTVSKYSNIEAIKVVYDFDTDKVYFINTKYYRLHYKFCLNILKYNRSLNYFNLRNYSDTRRRFGLVNINYFKDADKYVIEYNVVDKIGFENMEKCYRAIQNKFIKNKKLYVSLNNNYRLKLKDKFLQKEIPVLNPNDLFRFQKLQIINKGNENGELILIQNKNELLTKNLKNKIVLLAIDVLEMPVCKAIITTNFQTPLSHISILAQNRGIPVLAYPNGLKDSVLLKLINKNVCLKITKSEYEINECKLKYKEVKRKKERVLKANKEYKKLKNAKYIYLKDKNIYGSKVVNFSELKRVAKRNYSTPEGAFGIPFYYYNQHVSSIKIKTEIDKLLKDTLLLDNREQLNKRLKIIRKLIKKQPLDKNLLAKVNFKIDTTKHRKRFRFRSSSNAEDITGFNGAGLYTSKTGVIEDSVKTIEKAIKKVWASVWTLRAFEEREYFNINQKSVSMGILVHRSFPDDYMNGVAITKNLYRNYQKGFVINNQIGEHKVVDNEKGNNSEQIISYYNSKSQFYNQKDAVEYIATSNLNDYKPILTQKEIFELTQELEKIKRHFYRKFRGTNYKNFALDIEFKLANNLQGECKLYVKQVRLFDR